MLNVYSEILNSVSGNFRCIFYFIAQYSVCNTKLCKIQCFN